MTTAGTDWLAAQTVSPDAVRARWAAGELAEVRTRAWEIIKTRYCIVDVVPVVLALGRAGRLGPVLTYAEESWQWWLVPPGHASAFDGLEGVTVRPPGWLLRCPPPGESLCGRGWLERPDGTGRLTDPVTLAAALALIPASPVHREGAHT